MLEEARLPADSHSSLEIEWQIILPVPLVCLVRLGAQEGVQSRVVGCFGIAIEQEGGMVWVGESVRVQGLQVGGEVVYSLSVEKLPISLSWGFSQKGKGTWRMTYDGCRCPKVWVNWFIAPSKSPLSYR